ncbi:MAG: hypothetical protein ACI9G1_004567 [Pirellulaceae bacterium]|jgi:hypothetical protein
MHELGLFAKRRSKKPNKDRDTEFCLATEKRLTELLVCRDKRVVYRPLLR